jgi:hypothetical protein
MMDETQMHPGARTAHSSCTLYIVSRRCKHGRAEKARRDGQPVPSADRWSPATGPARVVVRQADEVERLAYTRTQAAQALGISRSTMRRLLAYVETIEMPWGARLIPVDELERLMAERRRTALPRGPQRGPGRTPTVPADVVARIRTEHASGKSLREIADDLTAAQTPTAHGGRRWWHSTVRAVLRRA